MWSIKTLGLPLSKGTPKLQKPTEQLSVRTTFRQLEESFHGWRHREGSTMRWAEVVDIQ